MNHDFTILQKVALFQGIKTDELNGMLVCLDAKVETYSKNQVIFLEGDSAKYVGIVLSGSVQIIKEDFYGNRSIVASAEPSELFAETFACARVDSLPISVIASEQTVIMLLDCKRIITTCGNSCRFHNTLIYNLLHVVSLKNLILNQKIEFVSKRTTKEKLMTYLMAEAKRTNSQSFTIPYDRQGLADYLGVERSAMSAELGKLRAEGRIEFQKNHFELI